MPLTLTNPVNAIPAVAAVQATAFEVIQFAANVNPSDVADQSITVIYAAGNYDATGTTFTQVGANRTLVLNTTEFNALLTSQPTLLPTIKPLLYSLIEAAEAVTGTIS